MPTTRRRATRLNVPPMSAAVVYALQYGEVPIKGQDAEADDGWFEAFQKLANDGALRRDWEAIRDELVADWIAERPGTRPFGWWRFDAPRWRRQDQPVRVRSLVFLDCAEPRRRLGGIGTPAFESLNVVPRFSSGLPVDWVSAFDVAYYNGFATDIHGQRIGTEYRAGDFAGLAPSRTDTPTFESQATYLARHQLLTAAECARLAADAFAPEAIVIPEADDPWLVRGPPASMRTTGPRREDIQ